MSTKMLKYVLKRLVLAVVTLWIVITITFFAMHAIPGGPFLSEKATTAQAQAAMEAKFGLDKPLGQQYLSYLKSVVKFDFGPSIKQRGRNVSDILLSGFKVSGKLGITAAVLAIIFGVILGSIAAINREKFVDRLIMVVTTAFVAMPSFIVGSLLLIIFCVALKWLPANGSSAGGMILPVVTLMLYPMSYITRLTRSSMLDVLGQDYIRTARAKGVSRKKIIYKHCLKNASIPVITYAGPEIAFIVTGSLVVEKIFAVPGIGRAFINSITSRDYTLIMGTTIFLAALIILMTFVSDILYKVVDPRIELG